MPKILITEPIPDDVIDYLKNFASVTVGDKGTYQSEEALIRDIPEYDGLLCMLSTPVSETVLKAGQNLKVVANFAVGYDNIDVEAAHDLGIKVANTPDVLTEACGDYAMGLLLALSRKFKEAEQYLRDGNFAGWEPLGFLGMELRDRTLGIIGMGRIGQAFADRARAFGMKIIYHNRTRVDEETEQELEAEFIADHKELAQRADVLSLNCPLTEETHHLVDKELLDSMPEHALLINISRGAVIDEAALAQALHQNQIAGAALDVFEEEPKVHPDLLTAPNTLLLPHIASATHRTRKDIGMLAAEAITSVLEGKADSEIPNLISR
ncbi:MAG: D-glycerate dehydrogenase [Gracilimonas sp.]|uniref:2-hydroxyacid dehydrogenase n=1 Tax=Gracilimonas TaxID=649462 RepID=UPI001B046912|nr:D-glycerate dehydrogenase [Gracilimonas sp.]MBO6585261.1 D-glycerate dehydrogenase [Gracilimonas sp.]MBO6615467.1 D-glycerate dehydrogenase [Gracilimonas sp.]